jgi:hypothetical protein
LLPLITELQQIKARKERHEQRKTAATAGGKQETSPEPYMIIVATTKVNFVLINF